MGSASRLNQSHTENTQSSAGGQQNGSAVLAQIW